LHNTELFIDSSFVIHHTSFKTLDTQWSDKSLLTVNTIMMPAENNRGFDALLPVTDDKKEIQLHLIEMKYTAPESNPNGISIDDITGKHSLAMNVVQKSSHVNAQNVYLIFACYRTLQKSLLSKLKELPNNVLVLDRQRLDILYGPTLVTRPHLSCPLS
jgi:hypothetical protein